MEKTLNQTESNCIKVVVFGPESTGKTTLAMLLAKHYKTIFVPEYSRIYAEMQLLCNKLLTKDDVLQIAEGQMQLENELAPKANKVLICDTDVLETKIYSEVYYDGYCPSEVEKHAVENQYHLYLLSYIDVPWEPDAIRDKPEGREELFNIFESELKKYNKPYIIIKGNEKERFQKAKYYIDELLEL